MWYFLNTKQKHCGSANTRLFGPIRQFEAPKQGVVALSGANTYFVKFYPLLLSREYRKNFLESAAKKRTEDCALWVFVTRHEMRSIHSPVLCKCLAVIV
jgi:hypothetical protein